jgi:hypothetical protein
VAVRDFKSDSDGEWVIENGDFATVADAEAVPQGIRIRVGMFLGECYLDESIGVDYIDSVFIKNADPLLVRSLIERAISGTPDVTNVIGAQLVNEGGRAYSIAYTADTIYADEPLASTVAVP